MSKKTATTRKLHENYCLGLSFMAGIHAVLVYKGQLKGDPR